MAEVLPEALHDYMRKPGDAPLNPRGVQGSKVLRATYREFKHELEHLSRDDCDVHAHPTFIGYHAAVGLLAAVRAFMTTHRDVLNDAIEKAMEALKGKERTDRYQVLNTAKQELAAAAQQ
jgi:hypothetical protein